MAIKIDLLPGHVKQRRNLQLAILASVCALALVGTGLAMALDAKQKQLQTAQTNLAVVTEIAAKTTAAESEKTAADTTAQPITDTVSFLLAAGKTGPQRAALLNQVRQYIYNDTVINSIDVSDGQQAVIEGTVKNPLEYSRFLLNLRRAGPPAPGEPPGEAGPLFSALPRGVGPGGFNNGNTVFVPPPTPTDQPIIVVYPLKVTASGPLRYPIPVLPDPAAAGNAAPGGAATGALGAPGGSFGGSTGRPPGGPSGGPPGGPSALPGPSPAAAG